MTKEEVMKMLEESGGERICIIRCGDEYERLCGEYDPCRQLDEIRLENETLKCQLKYAMHVAFGTPMNDREDLIK